MKTEEMIYYIVNQFIPSQKFDLTPGRHQLENDCYYNVEVYTSKFFDDCRYESHKKYVDIHYMVEGCELVYVTNIDKLPVTVPYSKEKDIIFFDGGQDVEPKVLEQGKYLIFYPKDGHKPCVCVENERRIIKKVIFKVKIDE